MKHFLLALFFLPYFAFCQTPIVSVSATQTTICQGNSTVQLTATAAVNPTPQTTQALNTLNSTAFNCDCPTGYVAVGYSGRKGQVLDQLTLACKKLNADGSLDPQVVYTRSVGSSISGGAVGPFLLEENTALVGISLRATGVGFYNRSATRIAGYGQSISAIAAGTSSSSGDVALTPIEGNYNSVDAGTVYVPVGRVVTGMRVTTSTSNDGGTFVGSIALRHISLNALLSPITINWSTGQTGPSINVSPTQTKTYTVTATNANGTSAPATITINVNEKPAAPTLVTQAGGSYPAGVSSLTISQNVGDVILAVSGCEGGTINWDGGNATNLAVATSNLGTQTFTANCTRNDCVSPTATATVTVVAPTLKVLSRDPDNDQLGNNTIKPYLMLQNVGTTPVPYNSITLRYWLTTQNNIGLLFQKNYVAIGQGNLNVRYVPISPARQGATGYFEYSFTGGAGSLAPNTDSGPIETQINKQDYSTFFQADDYSYINNSSFTLNPLITAYQDGTIFYGIEPTGTGSTRVAAEEAGNKLTVSVLGNPVTGQAAKIEISGVSGQTVALKLVDLQGKSIHSQTIKEAGLHEHIDLPLGNARGILLLDVSTATQRQQVKLLRP